MASKTIKAVGDTHTRSATQNPVWARDVLPNHNRCESAAGNFSYQMVTMKTAFDEERVNSNNQRTVAEDHPHRLHNPVPPLAMSPFLARP